MCRHFTLECANVQKAPIFCLKSFNEWKKFRIRDCLHIIKFLFKNHTCNCNAVKWLVLSILVWLKIWNIYFWILLPDHYDLFKSILPFFEAILNPLWEIYMLSARQFLQKRTVARASKTELFARKRNVLYSLSSSLEYRLHSLK